MRSGLSLEFTWAICYEPVNHKVIADLCAVVTGMIVPSLDGTHFFVSGIVQLENWRLESIAGNQPTSLFHQTCLID